MKEVISIGVYEWAIEGITTGTMLVFIECSLECSSLGIIEWDYEVVKEWPLLELKYNIKKGGELWTTVTST